MSTKPVLSMILDLNSIAELFNAPASNPFSAHEIETLGESGIDYLHKQLLKNWPRWPGPLRLVLRLPAEQLEPGLEDSIQHGLRRYCADKIQANLTMRRNTFQISWRQLGMAFLILLLAFAAIYFGFINPPGFLPPYLGAILAVLVVFAGSVSIFDAIWSLLFDWIPYQQDIQLFQYLTETEIEVEGRTAK